MDLKDTICALSTAQGMGAIAIIRLSGPDTFAIAEKVFRAAGDRHKLSTADPYSLLFGKLADGDKLIDEVMLAIYRGSKSYTGEDTIEINCHGSVFIQQEIIKLLLKNGARLAEAGEFTLRAFFNGKMDLSQAEAVADLIASENEASHRVAMQQMRGGYSQEIKELRDELINFASLIELELDFGEEDVEFADRTQLSYLLQKIKKVLTRLSESFSTGNVIKNGVPVAIVGAPNAGKSTLLNALLNEERAIVTEIAGTTRDTIEDEITIEGVKFRFIDTAGIRETTDLIEEMGIKKTYEKIAQSRFVLYLFNAAGVSGKYADNYNTRPGLEVKPHPPRHLQIKNEIDDLRSRITEQELIIVANKIDIADKELLEQYFKDYPGIIFISALKKTGLDELQQKLTSGLNLDLIHSNQSIVTNLRHYEALRQALADIVKVEDGMANNISGDFLAMDIRQAFRHLGSIIGEVDTDRDILGNIFGKFCIGK